MAKVIAVTIIAVDPLVMRTGRCRSGWRRISWRAGLEGPGWRRTGGRGSRAAAGHLSEGAAGDQPGRGEEPRGCRQYPDQTNLPRSGCDVFCPLNVGHADG